MQDGKQPNEPGWVFRPGDEVQPTAELPQPIASGPVQEAEPVPVQQTHIETEQTASFGVSEANPEQNYNQSGGEQEANYSAHIEWTASEYISNPKGAGWFMLLAVGSFVLAIVVYILSRDLVSTSVIAILGIVVAIFAARQPQTLQYSIDKEGLHIGQKFYPYAGFKAFSVAQEHAIGFIQLLPLKRFMPPLVIHYAPEDEDHIAEVLASYLPYEEHKADMVDSLTKKLRF